jgi:uncharacterized membrane protein YhaH (DUF805 family)
MTFPDAIKSGFQNFSNFRDRASRSEYWWWTLFAFIVGMLSVVLDSVLFSIPLDSDNSGPVNLIATLVMMIPGLAVSARRLHDIDKSGWWILIAFTVIGLIPLIYWYCKPSDDGINRFGPPPALTPTSPGRTVL